MNYYDSSEKQRNHSGIKEEKLDELNAFLKVLDIIV